MKGEREGRNERGGEGETGERERGGEGKRGERERGGMKGERGSGTEDEEGQGKREGSPLARCVFWKSDSSNLCCSFRVGNVSS